jgi:hypothetical protein
VLFFAYLKVCCFSLIWRCAVFQFLKVCCFSLIWRRCAVCYSF